MGESEKGRLFEMEWEEYVEVEKVSALMGKTAGVATKELENNEENGVVM